MSLEATKWAWQQKCPSGVSKSVLVYLADCANGDDCCYPSLDKIRERVQHTEPAIRRALKELVSAGMIKVEPRRPNGRHTSNRYWLQIEAWVASPSELDPTNSKDLNHVTVELDPPNPQELGPGNAGLVPANSQGNPLVSKKERTSLRSDSSDEPDGFSGWYALYPKKVGRGDASRAYSKALRGGALPCDLLNGLLGYQFSAEPQYQPMPATWLNKCRWQHELGTTPPTVERSGRPQPASRRVIKEMILGTDRRETNIFDGPTMDLNREDWNEQ